jgi:hypothetical protein
VGDSIDDGRGKAESPGGSFVTYLAVFFNDVCGGDFSAALQVNRIGENTCGDRQGQAQDRGESEGVRCSILHGAILPRRVREAQASLLLDAQTGYSQGLINFHDSCFKPEQPPLFGTPHEQ